MRGFVNTQQAHDALIAAVQRAGGVSAIYDQLQMR
jgi:osmotically-inducible protein OsmY